MSPLSVRRYRAERLLRQQFDALRAGVLATVRRRLGAVGVNLDPLDLEACYAEAWQGLYAAVLGGQEIANPAGWLVLVTFRRAIEEHRARRRLHCAGGDLEELGGSRDGPGGALNAPGERDLAAELDERARLRHLFEGLRGRLGGREREAAVLCYLQGLSRAEAAVRMGISEARMRKLMEGSGRGRPGVAAKVGALVEVIRGGGWCEEQGSLMRALAYGILDLDGERYQLALMHSGECPACRAYVASLRGLAAALPPVLLPGTLGASVLAVCGEGARGAIGGAGTSFGGSGSGAGAGAQAARGVGGTVSASGAAGAGGAAGGGWLLAGGPLSAKLAVGCLLALGLGAGCVALETGPGHEHGAPPRARRAARLPRPSASSAVRASAIAGSGPRAVGAVAGSPRPPATALTPLARASREFGPEQALTATGARPLLARSARASTARSPSTHAVAAEGGQPSSAGAALTRTSQRAAAQTGTRASAGGLSPAEREFAPG
jgi:DNA-directed RNA polymerase specialized sigma24 family protein